VANRIQIRRDTAANWTRVNPILSDGEPGLETDTNKVKYGDGTTAWASLDYASGSGNTLTNNTKTVSLGSDGILTMPPGNETTAGWIQWSHANDDLTNVAGAGFVDYFNAYTGLGLTAPTNTNAEKGIWFGTPADPTSPFQPETSMVFRNDTLYLPKNGYIKSHDINRVGYANLTTVGTTITIQTNNEHDWVFGTDGILTLPFSSTINDTPDAPGSGNGKAVEIKPGGVSHSNQLLRIYATAPNPDANHLHLTSGDLSITDLFLGDDNQFVQIATDGKVCIGTYGTSGNFWQFGTDGSLTLPGGSAIGYTPSVSTNITVNAKTWAFGVDGNLTIPGEIKSAAGTGSVAIEANDGNNTRTWTFGTAGTLGHPVLTVATLPLATVAGQRVFVSDADGVTRPVFDQIVTAGGDGGPYTVPVWSDGTNWRVG
jgi:hypothetical protein